MERFKSLQYFQVLKIAHIWDWTGKVVSTKLAMMIEMQKLTINQ
jgi:hypothetical protein